MSSIPSTGCLSLSLFSLHSAASSIVSVAAQRSQRIIFLPQNSVGASHRAGYIGVERGFSPPLLARRFHLDGVGNINGCGAE